MLVNSIGIILQSYMKSYLKIDGVNMKILIAGPLPTTTYSGGVAVFDKNIALELAKKNDVLIVSNNKSNLISPNIKNAKFYEINKIRHFKPDIIISSLWYSLFFSLGFSKITKIHILHGFTNFVSYSSIKFNLMHLIDKFIRKNFDYFLANSQFTKLINEQIFDLRVDGIFTIGLDSDLIRSLVLKNKRKKSNNKNIVFLGRIVPAKKLDVALKAVAELPSHTFNEFNIYGYGSEASLLKKKYSKNPNIRFRGPVNHERIEDAYKNSKVFISLNPSEPFGITYEEAIANGLFVVAPCTGGQVDFLTQFPDRCSLVDINNVNSVKKGIEKGLNSDVSPMSNESISKMGYEKTVKEIISVINNDT